MKECIIDRNYCLNNHTLFVRKGCKTVLDTHPLSARSLNSNKALEYTKYESPNSLAAQKQSHKGSSSAKIKRKTRGMPRETASLICLATV